LRAERFGLWLSAMLVLLVSMRFSRLGKARVEDMRGRLEALHREKAARRVPGG
jgi:hypothetical protein